MAITLKGRELEAEIQRSPFAPLDEEAKRIFFMKLTRNEVAELFKLSPSRISQLVTDGVLHQDRNGQYTLWEVIHEYSDHLEHR
jgi:hypothetical protein